MVAKDTVANGKDTVKISTILKLDTVLQSMKKALNRTMNNFNFDLLDDFDLLER